PARARPRDSGRGPYRGGAGAPAADPERRARPARARDHDQGYRLGAGRQGARPGDDVLAPMTDIDLARRHAPIVYFDAADPFLPELVGYAVLRKPGPSPTHGRYLSLLTPDGRRAEAVVEYALWTDWEIQHLYELEHAWS